MSIKPIKRKDISEQVFEQIKQNIITGKWLPGTKIPSELELAQLFNVSRVAVRDAIQRLVGMGVLTVKKGSGTYVTEMVPSHYFRNLLPLLMIEKPTLTEILEFRNIIESESARLAAVRATDEDISLLEETLEKMKQSKGDYKKFAAHDVGFHVAIAMATKNSIIVKITSITYDVLEAAIEEIVKVTGFEDGIYYHTKLLQSIKDRDSYNAAMIMREHIENIITKLKNMEK